MVTGLITALIASICYGSASVLEAVAARRAEGLKVFTQSLYLMGLGLDGVAWVASLVALQFLTLFTVQALIAGSLIVTVLLAKMVFSTRLGTSTWWAMGLLVAGLVVIALATGEQPATGAPRLLAPVLGAVMLLLTVVLLVLYRRRVPLAMSILAGLAASVSALAARGLELGGSLWQILMQPLLWVLCVAGVVAMASYTRALEHGSVGAMTAVFTVIEVVVPGVAGMMLLGDASRPGWEVAKFVAIALSLLACVWLAKQPGADPVHEAQSTHEDEEKMAGRGT
ncbi:MAG: hypothetical protein ACTIJ0_07140 [Glutamicibacter ardleyensis]